MIIKNFYKLKDFIIILNKYSQKNRIKKKISEINKEFEDLTQFVQEKLTRKDIDNDERYKKLYFRYYKRYLKTMDPESELQPYLADLQDSEHFFQYMKTRQEMNILIQEYIKDCETYPNDPTDNLKDTFTMSKNDDTSEESEDSKLVPRGPGKNKENNSSQNASLTRKELREKRKQKMERSKKNYSGENEVREENENLEKEITPNQNAEDVDIKESSPKKEIEEDKSQTDPNKQKSEVEE